MKNKLGTVLLIVSLAALAAAVGLLVWMPRERSAIYTQAAAEQQYVAPESTPAPDVMQSEPENSQKKTADRIMGETGRLSPGLMLRDGCLYLVDERGYYQKNFWLGALYFDETGRYTSGNEELDGYVRELISQVVSAEEPQEVWLREVYDYVRDNFNYLVRNYHYIGQMGLAEDEAITMFSTGKGNCYNYAAAFWALARGVGYSAKFVSGTVDVNKSPHGWVEIYQEDGQRLTYDVELEMKCFRNKVTSNSFFAMTDAERFDWAYVENAIMDDKVPRETNPGLHPVFAAPEGSLTPGEYFIEALRTLGTAEPQFSLSDEQVDFLLQDETLWDMSVPRNQYARSPYYKMVDYKKNLWNLYKGEEIGEPCWMFMNTLYVLDFSTVDFGENLSFTRVTAANYSGIAVHLIIPGKSNNLTLGGLVHAYAMPIGMSAYTTVNAQSNPCLVGLVADLSV